jgi:hypothetical protein
MLIKLEQFALCHNMNNSQPPGAEEWHHYPDGEGVLKSAYARRFAPETQTVLRIGWSNLPEMR